MCLHFKNALNIVHEIGVKVKTIRYVIWYLFIDIYTKKLDWHLKINKLLFAMFYYFRFSNLFLLNKHILCVKLSDFDKSLT